MTRTAIQGVRGAFSHEAALASLGDAVEIVECRSFTDLFDAVASGTADRGVVPVENSLAGSVQRSMDLFLDYPLHVVGEVRVRVRLCLAVRVGTGLGDVTRVGSHPVALEQCQAFFARHPRLEAVAAFDTAGSVRDLVEGRADYDGAIGSELAAELYGADVVEHELEDDAHNYTRFLVIGRDPAPLPETDAKTSTVFKVRHKPGSLHAALGVLRRHRVDLTRLESRPIRGRAWEYRFYADLRGPPAGILALAIDELSTVVEEIRVLGTYREEPFEP